MDEVNERLTAALIRRLAGAPARMYRSFTEKGQSLREYERLEKRGIHRVDAKLVAEYLERVGVECGSQGLIDAAILVKDVAENMRERDWEDQEKADRSQAEDDAEAVRWASVEWASTTAVAAHIRPKIRSSDLARLLVDLGYLAGTPGAYSLTEKAQREGVGKEVAGNGKVNTVHWNRRLFDVLEREVLRRRAGGREQLLR
jgi:hypothetical protein